MIQVAPTRQMRGARIPVPKSFVSATPGPPPLACLRLHCHYTTFTSSSCSPSHPLPREADQIKGLRPRSCRETNGGTSDATGDRRCRWPILLSRSIYRRVTSRVPSQRRQRTTGNHGRDPFTLRRPTRTVVYNSGEAATRAGRNVEVSTSSSVIKLLDTPSLPATANGQTNGALTIAHCYRPSCLITTHVRACGQA